MKIVYLSAAVILGIIAFLGVSGVVAQSGCVETISADGDYPGSWNSDCLSENTPTEPTNPPIGTRYARFYTFTLTAPADVTINLTSATDTYMYLIQGAGANGEILRENDDAESGNTNSRIQSKSSTRRLHHRSNYIRTANHRQLQAHHIRNTINCPYDYPYCRPYQPYYYARTFDSRADTNPATYPCPNCYACA